jgi:hypothetical protein
MSRPARIPAALLALAALAVPLTLPAQQPDSIAALRAGFLNPPSDAKPMVRWWWFGAAVVKPEILRELRQMKADGIGGAELAFVYPEVLDDPAKDLKNLPFLSPEMLDAVRYAQTEGRKLGLRIDVTLCSGWPYGGPAITLDQAVTRLRTAEVAVPPNATTIATPKLEGGETLLSAAIVEGSPTPPRRRGSPDATPAAGTWNATTARPLAPTGDTTTLAASSTPRVALFFIQSHTRQQVKRAAVGAEGYVLDPFSKQAVATHLAKVGEPLLNAFGSAPPYAIFSDSLEAYGADWTPDLPQQFKQRRGYDLIPHLPELVAGGIPAAEKVRHDYGRTLTELVDENYLTQIDAWAAAHHTKFRSQTYGDPAVDFSSQNLVGLAEGEGPQWRAFSTLRWATSANHVFGHTVTSGETFTWLHSPVFRATPLDMKAEADIDFIMGENQLIFHGWPYSPPASELKPGDPGWSLYAAAVFNDHNPWHPVMPAVTQYIARLSWLLRQGKPANQVAVLLPTDDAWAGFSPGHTSVTDAMKTLVSPDLMSTILSAGYNVDYIDAKAIDKVGLGTHQILVIPPTTRIPVGTLRKIHDWAAHNGKVISLGHVPTLDAEGNPSAEINQLSEAIAVIPGTDQLAQALHNAAKPDLGFGDGAAEARSQIGFIHRKLDHADVYFITNTSNQAVRTTIRLGTQYAGGEVLDPERGRPTESIDSQAVQLDLAPYASEAFLFDRQQAPTPKPKVPGGKSIEAIVNGWKVTFPLLQRSTPISLPYDWTQDPATLNYSGEVVYERDAPMRSGIKTSHSRLFLFVAGGKTLPGAPNTAPEEHVTRGPDGLPNPLITGTGPGMHAYFDPPIREAALVVINGKPAGALWHSPYRLDVTDVMHTGTNHIEIHVYNTALNAWSALPPHDYGPLKAKYGDRFQMQDLDRVKPLPSGILGPVELESDWTIK